MIPARVKLDVRNAIARARLTALKAAADAPPEIRQLAEGVEALATAAERMLDVLDRPRRKRTTRKR